MTLSIRLHGADGELAKALATIRAELGVSEEFPPEVEAEAREAVASAALSGADSTEVDSTEVDGADLAAAYEDLLDVPFFTIDPAESMDLDQAMHLERAGTGYRVRYAIADVPAFVKPGGAVDTEARRRGQTLYPPDGRIPLHPLVISEEAASLLPGVERGAYVWTFELDADARLVSTRLARARVRSRRRFSYDEVQELVDGGVAPDELVLLKEIGLRRILLEQERGGASLGRPDQEVRVHDGSYELIRRRPLEAEGWNAQVSLLTGMAAAQLMLDGGVGILRTMPPPSDDSIVWFRRRAKALGTPWEEGVGYGAYLRMLDAADPRQLAILHAAASLFRGAGYTAFDGKAPEHPMQSAVAAPYAHATAPLRRLVDRFVLVVCEALANGRDVPDWARSALPGLPAIMASSDGLAGRLDYAAISAAEAAVLHSRIGETFEATVIGTKNGGGELQLDDPAVTAHGEGRLVAGEQVMATLVTADVASGTVLFHVGD